MDAERKTTENGESARFERARFEREGRERVEDALHAQTDMTNQEAVKEATRLGGGDTYLVETDLEDRDEREDEDQPDGRPGPLANADNPER
ncbi:hypothetical protein QTA58_15840 [Neorhizobium sp. CSC1952]|uniref:hypothetical protein n=1 Tax=Neorhizobium sp. CSC1952 TaxID=2978974 RepID=UPI0025A666E7|nr:hypothetical protein [Rhizobium sp. CSC1952]WJR65696.1 hypothetical protein QTA58_15840 [Rhizobium sp. CSC1952]